MTTQINTKSNESYNELKELHGSELNVSERNAARYNSTFEDNIDRTIEPSSIVVIPDGMN